MYYNISNKNYISKQAGIGFKKEKIYSCYEDNYIIDWAKSWDQSSTPEDFGYKKLPTDFHFDHYINFKTGEIL